MPRVSVELQSTALSSASYDTDTQTLDVTFINGSIYTHEGVPYSVFENLRDAPSPGRYYTSNIKGQY